MRNQARAESRVMKFNCVYLHHDVVGGGGGVGGRVGDCGGAVGGAEQH